MLISSLPATSTFSYEAIEARSKHENIHNPAEEGDNNLSSGESSNNISNPGLKSTESNKDKALTAEERLLVAELQQRDNEVRSHEAAHIAAGGSVVAGAANFTYQKGPDGKLYAIGGEVAIRSSGGSTPQEKIAIAKQIQAGALAPANPSPQDLKVASSAAMMESRARQELASELSQTLKEKALNAYENNR